MSERDEDIAASTAVVAADLRQRIVMGDLTPNSRLRQREIADAYGVSAMPARDAIRILINDGLAVRESAKTIVVAPLSLGDFVEIMEMRVLLEPHVLQIAGPNLSQDILTSLSEDIGAHDKASSPDKTAQCHWDFHRSLYAAANRPRMLLQIENLNLHLIRYLMPIWTTIGISDDWIEHHMGLVDMLRARRFDEAADELRNDLEETMFRVISRSRI